MTVRHQPATARNQLEGYWQAPTLSGSNLTRKGQRILQSGLISIAPSGHQRTGPFMYTHEAPQNEAQSTAVDSFIDRYTPQNTHSNQWTNLRSQIISLVRRASPQTAEQASLLLGAFSPLLAEAESLHFEGALNELLTEAVIERCIARLNSSRTSLGRIQNIRRVLLQLHQVLHDLPTTIFGKDQLRKASDPVSPGEINMLVQYLSKPTRALHLHLARRLVLALGAGLVGKEADNARLTFGDRGITSITDQDGTPRALTKKWIASLNALVTPELELYKLPDVQATASWLRKNHLSYLWPRLRDEWLLEQLDGSEPAFVQFRRAAVTYYDLDRVVLRWNQVPLIQENDSLRNRRIYRQIDCEAAISVHRSNQDLNNEELDRNSKNAMSTLTGVKISKAESRRMSAAHLATVVASPKAIPACHQKIMNAYICKSALEPDRARVHAAFVSVMERTSHILSTSLFRKVCSDVSALTAWAATMNHDLAWTSLMTHQLINDYSRVEKKQGDTAGLSQRYRRLKCLASALNPGVDAPPRVAPVGYRAVSDPYSAEEMASIERIARMQNSPSVTRQLALILGASRGAGAAVTELRELRRKDIDDRGDEGIFITLGEPERRRTIPVRRAWEEYMRTGIQGLAPDDLVIGTVRNRKNIAGEVLARTTSLGKDAPHIEAGRLRTTWISELMSEAIPVQVILHAAGLKGARTLTDLSRRFSQQEINERFGVLRGSNS